jgi:hypothetical protein
MWTPRIVSAGLALALLLFADPRGAGAGFLDSNDAVSAATQANGGGCYPITISPGLLDMLVLINPEWAAVDVGANLPPVSAPVTMHGTVSLAKINETGDFPGDHVTDDQNTFLVIDSTTTAFVATGNVGPDGVQNDVPGVTPLPNLEMEWEIGKYPLFAWAGPGDQVTAVGRHIWDCGHPNPTPAGTCSTTLSQSCILDSDCTPPLCPTCVSGETCVGVSFGYHSELHPPQAVAVSRVGQGFAYHKTPRGGRSATRTEVWISNDGGGAGDRCIVTHQASSLSLLTVECFPLSQPLANVDASDFAFDIPLPPEPPGNTKPPRVRVYDQTPKGLPRANVETTFVPGPTPVVHAVVKMTTPIKGVLPGPTGKSIVVGWRHDHVTPMTRLRVDVTALEIVNPLKPVTPAIPVLQRCSVKTTQDCSATPCPSGDTCLTLGGPIPGWQIFLEVNGNWQAMQGLTSVQTPTTVPQKLSYDLALPAGGTLRLHATGKSLDCREAQLYGQSLTRDLSLYGLTDGATCLNASSHDVGRFDVSYTDPNFGSNGSSMNYVTPVIGGEGGACLVTTSQLCLTDADCPGGETCVVTGGSFKLHYTVTKH